MPGLRAWWQLCSSQKLHLLCPGPHLWASHRQASKVPTQQELQSLMHSAKSTLLLLHVHRLTHVRIQMELHQGGIWLPGIPQICTGLGQNAA